MPQPAKKIKPSLQAVEDKEQVADDTAGEPEIEMVEIPFRGVTFTVPKDMDEWDTEACLAMGENQYAAAAKMLLGPGQWALLQSLGSKRRDIREFLIAFGIVVDKECVG